MKKYNVTVNGTVYEVDVEEVKAVAVSDAGNPAPVHTQTAVQNAPVQIKTAGEGETVKAPMPGTVLDIKAVEGQPVKSGDVLLILEAMKMENEITAPVPGTVKSIDVVKGSNVNAGDVLVTFK